MQEQKIKNKTSFPRILRRLREEKNISQKNAAKALCISQALLSHYEKGIRECGLDFLIRASKYYEVTADKLLGIRNNDEITEEDGQIVPEDTYSINFKNNNTNIYSPVYKKLLADNIIKIFDDIKEDTKEKSRLTGEYFTLSIFNLFTGIIDPEDTDQTRIAVKNKLQFLTDEITQKNIMQNILDSENICQRILINNARHIINKKD